MLFFFSRAYRHPVFRRIAASSAVGPSLLHQIDDGGSYSSLACRHIKQNNSFFFLIPFFSSFRIFFSYRIKDFVTHFQHDGGSYFHSTSTTQYISQHIYNKNLPYFCIFDIYTRITNHGYFFSKKQDGISFQAKYFVGKNGDKEKS